LYFETVRAHLEGLISDVRDPRDATALLIGRNPSAARSPQANATGWRGLFDGNTALETRRQRRGNSRQIENRCRDSRALFRKAISLPSSAGVRRSKREIDQAALQLVANVQGLLVLAKSGLSDADIRRARSGMLATIS